MNNDFANLILFMGLIPALSLLLFPKIDYVLKSIFTAFITIFLIYFSIKFTSINLAYLLNYESRDIYRISWRTGGYLAFFSGLIVLCVLLIRKDID